MTALATLPHGAKILAATRADTDRKLLDSWIASLGSPHTRRNFQVTGARFISALKVPLRQATLEDVRDALELIVAGTSAMTARQYILRVKAFLSFAHQLGYTLFNAGVPIKPGKEQRGLAKRIVSEMDVRDVIRASAVERNFLIAGLLYNGGLRVSELVALNAADVIRRSDGRVQLHVVGKGGKERAVLLPDSFGPHLVALCAGKPPEAPLFLTKKGQRLGARGVNHLVKKLAARAGVNPKLSPHWLRHAHASHALDRGAPLHVVAATLGHANISTTSDYLHAKPGSASGDSLDPDIWKAPAG